MAAFEVLTRVLRVSVLFLLEYTALFLPYLAPYVRSGCRWV